MTNIGQAPSASKALEVGEDVADFRGALERSVNPSFDESRPNTARGIARMPPLTNTCRSGGREAIARICCPNLRTRTYDAARSAGPQQRSHVRNVDSREADNALACAVEYF